MTIIMDIMMILAIGGYFTLLSFVYVFNNPKTQITLHFLLNVAALVFLFLNLGWNDDLAFINLYVLIGLLIISQLIAFYHAGEKMDTKGQDANNSDSSTTSD